MAITVVIGIILLLIFIWCIWKGFNDHNYLFLIPIILIGIFLVYTFGTTKGALRFAVLWRGYPVEAYQVEFKEYKLNNGNYKRYFETDPVIKTANDEELGLFEVNYYWIIKVAKYYGY